MKSVIQAYLNRHCPNAHEFIEDDEPAVHFLHEGDMNKFSALFEFQVVPEQTRREGQT